MLLFGGIDPTASSRRPTFCALINEKFWLVKLKPCRKDAEIVAFFPSPTWAIGLDAPCTLPLGLGRCCMEDVPQCNCQPQNPWKGRIAERELRSLGIHAYVISRESFAKGWIRRGLRLRDQLLAANHTVLEVFPTATKKRLFPKSSWQLKSRREERQHLQSLLREWIEGLPTAEEHLLSHDELDALLAALTVLLHYYHATILVGDQVEGQIVIPRLYTTKSDLLQKPVLS